MCIRELQETGFVHVEFAASVEPQERFQKVSACKSMSLGENLEVGNF